MESKWDNLYIQTALEVSKLSKCPRKGVGTVILLESGLTAFGVNGFPEGQEEQWTDGSTPNPLVTHSELNALGKLLEQGVSAKGATVYVTLSPCTECSKLLVRAKVKRVVYLEHYRDTSGIDYLKKYGVIVEHFNKERNNEGNMEASDNDSVCDSGCCSDSVLLGVQSVRENAQANSRWASYYECHTHQGADRQGTTLSVRV